MREMMVNRIRCVKRCSRCRARTSRLFIAQAIEGEVANVCRECAAELELRCRAVMSITPSLQD